MRSSVYTRYNSPLFLIRCSKCSKCATSIVSTRSDGTRPQTRHVPTVPHVRERRGHSVPFVSRPEKRYDGHGGWHPCGIDAGRHLRLQPSTAKIDLPTGISTRRNRGPARRNRDASCVDASFDRRQCYSETGSGLGFRSGRSRPADRMNRHGQPPTAIRMGANSKPVRTCSYRGCKREHEAHGYCVQHSRQLRRGSKLKPIGPPRNSKGKPSGKCSTDGCDRERRARGLCRNCYLAAQRAERPPRILQRDMTCSFDGCARQVESKGYCATHAGQLRAGKPLTPIGSTLHQALTIQQHAKRILAKSIPDGECLIFRGATSEKGYGLVWHSGKKWKAHRLVMAATTGLPLPTLQARHVCGRKDCINPEHLTAGTNQENAWDRKRRQWDRAA